MIKNVPFQNIEQEIKDTIKSPMFASYLDISLNRDINGKPHVTTQLYDRRDDFILTIINFPLLCTCSNIPSSPAYVTQLI